MVEHQAGMPILLKPLSGNSSAGPACGPLVKEPIAHWPTTYGTTYLVADSALYSDAHLQHLAETPSTWLPRGPATWRDAQAALAPAAPHAMPPLTAGYRSHALRSTSGGVEQRWLLIASEPRQPQARRTVDKQLLQHRAQAGQAWKQRCGTALACAADAQQALARFTQGLQATYGHTSTVRAQPRYGNRGRPGRDAPPDHLVYQVDGALASSLAARQGLIDPHRCCILATNERDEPQRSPQAVLHGDTGQGHAARGFRFLQAPPL